MADAAAKSRLAWTRTSAAQNAGGGDPEGAWQQSLDGALWRQLPTILRVARPFHALTLAALSVLEAYIVSRSELSSNRCMVHDLS